MNLALPSISQPLRVIFCGTPQFAVPTLKMLLAHPEHFEVLGVLTQPDRPSGRGQKLTPPPVKVVAEDAKLTVHQPQRLRKSPEVIDWLREQEPDFLVTAAFGQILSQEVLDIPKQGTVNVHASLLPEYRGPNPIQWAILDGKHETGITTMLTDIGVDTGDMLCKATVPIGPNARADELIEAMAHTGAELLAQTLVNYSEGRVQPVPQDSAKATHAPKLSKSDATIHWAESAQTLHNRIRGQQPWPGATVTLNGQILKVGASILPGETSTQDAFPDDICELGTIRRADANGLWVQTQNGLLCLTQLQPAGKRMMNSRDWFRGVSQELPLNTWWPQEQCPHFELITSPEPSER